MFAPLPEAAVSEVTRVLDLAGVAANAILGGAIARRQRFDVVGLFGLAVISGLGGGIVRDVLLQHGPPVALTDVAYLLVALMGAAVILVTRPSGTLWHRVFQFVDAVALGCWAVAGAQKTLDVGLGALPAILLGTITAVGGGAIRDVTLRRPPKVFRPGPLEAAAAVFGSVLLVAAHDLGHATVGVVLGIVVTTGSRLIALRLRIHAPRIPYTKSHHQPREGDGISAAGERAAGGAPQRGEERPRSRRGARAARAPRQEPADGAEGDAGVEDAPGAIP
jgi:uncharacterized membrane protein YeiH